MNCTNHPEIDAAGVCVACGKPYCAECIQIRDNRYYCQKHMEAPAPAATGPRPGLAIVLNLLPGLGYLYLGLYERALIAFLLFVAFTRMDGSFVVALMAFCAFDAHRQAHRLCRGEAAARKESSSRSLGFVAGIALILAGLIFALSEMYDFDFPVIVNNCGPVLLIGVGGWLIYSHFRDRSKPEEPPQGAPPAA